MRKYLLCFFTLVLALFINVGANAAADNSIAYKLVKESISYLNEYTFTNSTTAEEIYYYLTDKIKDSSSTFTITKFSKVNATSSSLGEVKFILTIKDKDGRTSILDDSELIYSSRAVNDSNKYNNIKNGWGQLADGSRGYYDNNGTKVTNKWIEVDGLWYYLKADGAVATSWFNDKGKWYYLTSSGARVTGWNTIDGNWYHFDELGVMNTGWYNDNGNWYYLESTGRMLANVMIDGRYRLDKSGVWIK